MIDCRYVYKKSLKEKTSTETHHQVPKRKRKETTDRLPVKSLVDGPR